MMSDCVEIAEVVFFVVIAEPAFAVLVMKRVNCVWSVQPAFGVGEIGGVPDDSK
jgi:hypothetical protein